MFTGIIQAVGEVVSLQDGVLLIDAKDLDVEGLTLGESIAVDGVCLTLVSSPEHLKFELSPETISRTAFADLGAGSAVNLERAMQANDRFGGHIVQGHVDGVGEVVSIREEGNSFVYRFRIPSGRYVIEKGSITVNGISLTVVEPEGNEFDVWVIPHTLANTNLGRLMAGSKVNIEYDVVAKYLEKLAQPHLG
ncbi:MAG: riboflavin synthase [Armatimonadetes bacterium]|nr:riboflavin synthase [Armatimonadota bacterium]